MGDSFGLTWQSRMNRLHCGPSFSKEPASTLLPPCRNCQYRPGEMSGCDKDWPGREDENGYVQECVQFERIADAGENFADS